MNRVSVKIFGQSYTIVGTKNTEAIMEIAEYVDQKMREIYEAAPDMPRQMMAVLSAVNLADEYFTTFAELKEVKARATKAEEDISKYEKLWDEAKESHINSKHAISELENKNQIVKQMLEEKISQLEEEITEKVKEIDGLKENYSKLEDQLAEASTDLVTEMDAKYKDLESSFFDIQMENIQLKGELDRYKKNV